MASITIRNLDEAVKKRLRKQAAEHGRSLEAEARDILSRAPASPPSKKTTRDLWNEIREIVEPLGGIELEVPLRGPMRPLPFADEARALRRKK